MEPWWCHLPSTHPPTMCQAEQSTEATCSLARSTEARKGFPSPQKIKPPSKGSLLLPPSSLARFLRPAPALSRNGLPEPAHLACPPRSPRDRTRCCPGGALGRGRWSGCCTPPSRPATSHLLRSLWSPPPPPPYRGGPVSQATARPRGGKGRYSFYPSLPCGLGGLTESRQEENTRARGCSHGSQASALF